MAPLERNGEAIPRFLGSLSYRQAIDLAPTAHAIHMVEKATCLNGPAFALLALACVQHTLFVHTQLLTQGLRL